MDPQQDTELEQLIARYLQQESEGRQPALDQLVARHPHLAAEVEAFLKVHNQLRSAAESTWGHSSAENDQSAAGSDDRSEPSSDVPLARLDDYEILDEIDRGGMGIVYRARQRSLGRIVALKTIRSGLLANSDEIRRFQREARAAAALEHPGIVPVHEVGQSSGIHYFSMPLVDGRSLDEIIQSGGVTPREAARIVLLMSEAVQFAHQRGIIHRDLKPGNVLIDSSGQPRITDFGLATSLAGDPKLTRSGQILGTPSYMAPEQSVADHEPSPRIDVYGLGATLYALLTGHAPFESEDPLMLLMRLRTTDPELPRKLNPSVPAQLQRICMRCLERRPELRYASAQEVGDDLRRFLGGEPIAAAPLYPWHRFVQSARRRPVLVAHVVCILSIWVIATATYFLIGQDPIYYRHFVLLLSAWLIACFALHRLTRRRAPWSTTFGAVWAIADASFVTALLVLADPPRGPLLVGYPLMIVLAGLFVRVRFVVFMTVVSILSFGLLVLLTPDEPMPPHYAALFAAALAAIGLALGSLVGHFRRWVEGSEPRHPGAGS